MKTMQTALRSFLTLSLFGGLTVWATEAAAAPPLAPTKLPGSLQFYASEPVTPGLSPALRDLPPISDKSIARGEMPRRIKRQPPRDLSLVPVEQPFVDPLLGLQRNPFTKTPMPLQVFNGISFTGSYPPDPIGDVGPNHYVQAVNVSVAVYDKNGGVIVPAKDLGDLWLGQSASCANGNGDPVVLYDGLADRWFIAQLSGGGGAGVCIAVSQTPDPGGQYHVYRFGVPNFPDYLKFGVWPDAYYMGSNENSYTAYAFDRANILTGQPATFQRFAGEDNFLLPADVDGATPPPAGAPGYFYTFKDNNYHGGGGDRIEVFELHVDWVNTANTTFNLATTIPIAAYTYTVCGFFQFNCIQQQGTNQRLDAISEWPMWRLQYRNFGAYETLVGNFTVDVNNNNQAGIRWFELRKGGGQWMLQQEGTHAPDGDSRFVGSIAMDKAGNIALGYSVSSSMMFPSVRYATRKSDDPPGTLQAEVTLQAGGGSQPNTDRWGDYSSMNVDPTDDCTFFYTMEYVPSAGSSWTTVIGKFRMAECGGKPNGDPCAGSFDCMSNFCVDGVCCDTDCGAGSTADCQACSVASGAGADGTCSPLSAGTECRGATTACDAPEQCDGTAVDCPPDGLLPAGTTCRPSTAPCDAAEACDGMSTDCPADALAAAGTVCRGAADSCDITEQCDGTVATCPADVVEPDGTACDNEGTCSGGQCTPPGGPNIDPEDEGGCGCRVLGAANESGSDRLAASAALALMGLAAAGAVRRRRNRRQAGRR